VKISKSTAALAGVALLTVLVLIIVTSRGQEPALSTVFPTPSPADVSASVRRSRLRPRPAQPTRRPRSPRRLHSAS
jgi:hypothetical protein